MSKAEKVVHPNSIPFNSIIIDPAFNVRTRYNNKTIEELAEAIDAEGLQTPLSVRPVGHNGSTEYHLTSGFRRSMALKILKWGSKDIPIIVREFESVGKSYLANIAENTGREDVHPADQAKRFFELEKGISLTASGGLTAEVEEGAEGEEPVGEIVKLTRKEIAVASMLSQAHIGNLIRSYKNLSNDSKKAWLKHDLPLSFVFELARSVDGAPISDEEQEETLSEYLVAKEAENATGRKRKNKKKGEESESDTPKRKEIKNLFDVLCGQVEEVKGLEKAFLMGKIQAIRFLFGEAGVRNMSSTSWASASDAIEKAVDKHNKKE